VNAPESCVIILKRVDKDQVATYRVFHRFGQAKFPDGGSVLDLKQFSILPQLLAASKNTA